MSTLLLLNGPPGVGKSTLATAWAAAHVGRRCIDPDVLRTRIPDPTSDTARLAARAETIVQVTAWLSVGDSVVVPQLCGRPDFPDQLRAVADRHGAAYVEILLLDSLAHLQRRLRVRAASDEPHHRLAADELDDFALQQFRDAVVARAGADPDIVVVECSEGQDAIALRAIEQLVGTA